MSRHTSYAGYVPHRSLHHGTCRALDLATHIDEERVPGLFVLARYHAAQTLDARAVQSVRLALALRAKVSHPRVPAQVAHGVHEGDDRATAFAVYRYAWGVSVARLLDGDRVPEPVATAIVTQAAQIMDDLNEQLGPRHLDIDLSNLRVGWDGRVRITLPAPLQPPEVVEEGRGDEPRGVLAPERIWGRRITARSHVFSLGAMLYELAAGRPPFPGTSEMERLIKITREPPAPAPEISAVLRSVVLRALQRDPSRRHSRPLDLAKALEAEVPARTVNDLAEWIGHRAQDARRNEELLLEDYRSQATRTDRDEEELTTIPDR